MIEKNKFEKLVAEAIDGLPEKFQRRMNNINIAVEDRPSRDILRKQGIKSPMTLLGLYQGVPLKRRGVYYSNVLPDMITIYQEPIEMLCRNENSVKERVREVVMHELGHHFGMTEEELARQ